MPYCEQTVAAYIGYGHYIDRSSGTLKFVPSLMEYHVNDRNQTLKEFPITEDSVADKEALKKAIKAKNMAFNEVRVWVREGYFWAGVFTKSACWQYDPAEAERLNEECEFANAF